MRLNVGVEQHKMVAEWVQDSGASTRVEVILETKEWQLFIDATGARVRRDRFGATGAHRSENFVRKLARAHPEQPPGTATEFERRLALADAEADERALPLRQAEALMVEETPIIPLGVYTQHHLIKPYVRGYDLNLLDKQSLRRVWIDPAWARK